MKKFLALLCVFMVLLCCACGSGSPFQPDASPTPTGETTEENGEAGVIMPAGPSGADDGGMEGETSSQEGQGKAGSKLYDPSIFIIEASGTWRDELAPGQYVDYECEFYLDKVDSSNNRVVTGAYQGFFWMKTTVDNKEFFSDLLKDVPVEIRLDAEAEAICDNLGIFLNTEDDKAWVNYNIYDDEGNPLPLTQDTPVAKGSFVAVPMEAYVEAYGEDKQYGSVLEYSDTKGTAADVHYIIHVQPDQMESGGVRKVVIHLTCENTSTTIEGTMRRIPGYPEDVLEYVNSAKKQEALKKHLK